MKWRRKLSNLIRIFKIIGRYEPVYLALAIPQIFLSSMLPLLYVYFPKFFIEQLISGNDYSEISKTILLYIGILLAANIVNSFTINKCEFYIDRFSKKIRLETGNITMSLPLEDMEGVNYRDKLTLANNITQITDVMGLLQSIIANLITIIGLVAIIIRLDFIFVLLVFVTLCIKVLFVYLTYKHNEKRRKLFAANDRIGNYLNKVAYSNLGAAKEIRINNLSGWFMGKIKGYRNEMLRLQYGNFKRNALFESITAVIMALQTLAILWILSIRFINGFISIADFTMYFSAVTTLTTTLSAIVMSIGEYKRQQLNISDFVTLKEVDKNDEYGCHNAVDNTEIIFHNVSFLYPNTERLVLDCINIRITPGEKLSIVGQNGAGKSTFIKLLCKFYKPTSGFITIGGVDIWKIENNEYNQLISAVFQDYQNFSFTIGENVSMGQSNGAITEIINDIGLRGLLDKLPDGIDTYLTRKFDANGVELSGGEEQKLAISRAVYKNTPILILDEPTASLDPKAESEIYDSFFDVARDKTTIFISHRFASSTVADKIAVFEDGKIVEYGTHIQLMHKNKKYAEMFNMQKESYVDERIETFREY